eukprot:CAMPEP_0197186970 /NCGR_PEP_ID=MMETSP1423-20130617/14956_1 /TAXON_ID=476441 /ORGANISM="Pseudo-nitzschia heimii, Strain UNC1101" /LENGTH=269 /DNA_ID=CAMNT_0042638419 /DNA_START=27 /DNA_END=836 /DNA_ORIENTATION=-
MATASMTMASQSPSNSLNQISSALSSTIDRHIESREDSIEKLKSSLIQFTRTNDRRMVMRKLKEATFLSYIPLEAPSFRSSTFMSKVEAEVSRERVLLNGTLLKPPSAHRTLKNSGSNSGPSAILRLYLKELCKGSKLNEKIMYERVIMRLAKSSTLAEIHSILSSFMESAELIVKEVPSDYTIKSTSYNIMNKNKGMNDDDLPDLKLYNSESQIHMTLDTTFHFGLYRRNDTVVNRPWIVLRCKFHERLNVSTNETFRSLSVKTPNLY